MSDGGGDTGGGGFDSGGSSTGAGDSGGSSKGGQGQGETGAAGKGASDGATFDPGGNVADYSGGGGYTDPTSGYAPSDSGGSGALPSEITTGASDPGASQWGAPSINDFIDTSTDGGFNLGGSGPVGGDSGLPGAGGGTNTPMAFDTYSTSGDTVPRRLHSNTALRSGPGLICWLRRRRNRVLSRLFNRFGRWYAGLPCRERLAIFGSTLTLVWISAHSPGVSAAMRSIP